MFTRTGNTTSNLTVLFAISGSASNGLDYVALSNSVIIPAGAASAAITVRPSDDAVSEPAETVTLGLAGSSGYAMGASNTATVTIADDDPPLTVPPTNDATLPLVRVSFNETSGLTTPNLGTAGGSFTLTAPRPQRSANAPASTGNPGAIDLGTSEGNYAVDSDEPINGLRGLTRFTLTGWLNNRSVVQGSGGNRVLSCVGSGPDGFELIYKGDGSLILTVNQGPDSSSPRSSASRIPEDFFAGAANWRFFAVTYDAILGQVQFFFGSNASDAALDVTRSYAGRGAVGPGLDRLTIGHMNPIQRAGFLNRIFRGLIDEVQIFDRVLPLAEIVSVQRLGSAALPPASPLALSSPLAAAPARHGQPDTSSPGPPARILSIGFLANWQVRLEIAGIPGQWCDLLASADLTDWAIIGGGILDENGRLELIDIEATEFPARFYQVVATW
jgi:hypothetical protein